MTLLGVAEGNTRLDQTSLPRTRRCFKVDAKQQQLSSAAILEKHAIIITRIPVFHSLASSITARLPYQFFYTTSVAPLRTLTTPLTRITNACFTEGLSSCCNPSRQSSRLDKRAAISKTISILLAQSHPGAHAHR